MAHAGTDGMARQRYLARAPIVEAIFDVRAPVSSSFGPAGFNALGEREKARYPVLETRHAFRAFVEMGPGQSPKSGTQDLGFEGVVCKATDELSLVQFRRDGFTFNRLAPYTSWEELLPEVSRLWQVYADGVKPEVASRVAVRFINRLTLPMPVDDFSRFLTRPPGVPDTVPQAVSAFLTRVTVVDPERSLAAHIVQALEPGASETSIDVMLDIDAFSQSERGFGCETVTSIFQQLRDLKNDAFFGSITETTAEMYQ